MARRRRSAGARKGRAVRAAPAAVEVAAVVERRELVEVAA
jgi:hypothetical protein